jgi:glycosyltransferase involved in cell wall biosynthesis
MTKIYYIANARMPSEKAHGIQLAKMCEAFVERGVDLTLVLPRYERRSEHQHQSIREVYGLRVDIPVIRLPVITLARHTELGFNVSAFSFAITSFVFGLKRRLNGEQAILYALDMDQFSFFLLPLAGLPVFLEAHGAKHPNFFTRYFFRHVRGVIANSGGTRDALVRDFSLTKERTLVAPNGIDLAHFASIPSREEARQQLGLPLQDKIVLYIGRFYDWKGLDIVSDAAKRAPGISWYLVGGDDAAFRGASGIQVLPENLHCLGGKQFGEIPLWLRAADALLVLGTKCNEYSWTQTSPMKLFEYMAAKRPIVASGTPANREIVSEEEAFLYEPDNTESLVETVRRAVNEGSGAGSKVTQASAKVTQWTWAARARRILDFLNKS